MQVNIDCTVFLKYYTQGRFLTPGKCELQNPVLESAETVKASRHQFLELIRPWSSIKSSSYSKLSSVLPPHPHLILHLGIGAKDTGREYSDVKCITLN